MVGTVLTAELKYIEEAGDCPCFLPFLFFFGENPEIHRVSMKSCQEKVCR